ncbi:MAG: helix-turn-helix domain-containing protein [Coriobacteriales bacterium]
MSKQHQGRDVLARWREQFPLIPFFGFSFWIAWNLSAFSGVGWYDGTENAWSVFELTTVHLSASFVTLIAFYVFSKQVSAFIEKPLSMLLGGALGVVGAVLIVVSGPLFLLSLPLFYAGAVCAGIGTTFFFARSAGYLSALIPRIAFIRICEALLVAVCVCCVAMTAPKSIQKVLFVLIPAFSALLLAVRPYQPAELRVMRNEPGSLKRYGSFLFAVVVFSAAAQFLQRSFFPVPRVDSLMSFNNELLLLIVVAVCLLLVAAAMDNFGFGGIFLPAMLVIIVLLVAMPVLESVLPSALSASISSAALYSCNVMVWGLAAYAVFQSQRNAIRIFCSVNASLVAGSLIGNVLIVVVPSDTFSIGFILACVVLALAAIVVVVFVFPERKIESMFIPIDEKALNVSDGSSKQGFAPWKQACADISMRYGLSERESEVFGFLTRGKTNQQIADILTVSPYTIRAHTRNIYAKLDVHSRGQLSDFVHDYIDNNQ